MKLKSIPFLLLTISLLLAGCAPELTAAPASAEPTAVTAQTPAIADASNSPEAPAAVPEESVDLIVFAASSLTAPFGEIGKLFEVSNPGTTVVFNFAGSQQLTQQIMEGAPADVFASANKKQMDAIIEAGEIEPGSQLTFANNHLFVVIPKDNPAGLTELKDLSKPDLKLVLASQEVPVGQYSLDFLDKAAEDPEYGMTFREDVLKNVVSYEENVKAVLTKVALGEADAGIVYISDLSGADADKVARIEIPEDLNVIASYPIATIRKSKNSKAAQAFVDLALSPEGQDILAKYNFIPAAEQAAAGGKIIVTDALGREVTFEKPPERIVLNGKALFMIADAIYTFPEASRRIAAIGDTNQGTGNFIPLIDPSFNDKIQLGKEAGVEQIAAVQPDLVILKSSASETIGAPLEQIGIPVVYLDFETEEQYQRDLATLGQLFQNEARAQEVASFYQDRIDRISQAVAGLKNEDKPRTLLLYYSDKEGEVAFNVPPMGWMQTYLVQTAGGNPVWADANPGKGWTKVSLEQVAAWDPDQVYIVSYNKPTGEVIADLKADPQWQELRAMKDGKVYGFASDLYSWDQPDTRWALGLFWLAKMIHPDLFSDMDIVQEAEDFYQELYGMDEAAFQKEILPTLMGNIP